MPEIQIPTNKFYVGAHEHQEEVLCHIDNHPEVRHRVVVWHRRARKTSLGLNVVLRDASRLKNKTFAYVAPWSRQAKKIAWLDPMMLKRYMPEEVLEKPFNESELYATFRTGSVLQIGGADDPDRWVGTGHYGWVLDEFAKMRNGKQLYEEIIAPIIAENGGWVLFLYTPYGRNHGWEYFEKARDNFLWERWYMPVTESGVLSDERIQQAKESMAPHLFQQEMMCEFLVQGGGVFPRVDECVAGLLEKPKPGGRYVVGVDLGKLEDWTVITVLDRQRRHVVAWERFQKFDWNYQKERLARLSRQYSNALTLVDTSGGTRLYEDSLIDDLTRAGISARGFQFTPKSKKHLVEKLSLAIADRRVTFPKELDILINELKDFDIRISKAGNEQYGAPEGLHDDAVISLALAVEALGGELYATDLAEEAVYQPARERFKLDV